MQKIDNLRPGTLVELKFGPEWVEPAVFLKIAGSGEERRAEFVSASNNDQKPLYTWEAYRYNGHWAFGTSADRLSLVQTAKETKTPLEV